MKKILVTGAGGTVGLQVIRFLLSEGKYEITALELKNRHVYKRLKPFRKRINIVYGDINDETIVDALIKDHDVVIHLAGVLPPLANVREIFVISFSDETVNVLPP
jgi:nucleoside-diphosphate-sugar epimerase